MPASHELIDVSLTKTRIALMLKLFRRRSFKTIITLLILTKTTLIYASIGAVLERANTLYANKNYEDARETYEHATELDKGSLSAWRGLGWSYWALGKKARAYKIWTDVIKGFPGDLPTILTLAQANEQDHRWDEAIRYYSQLLNLQPNELVAHRAKARIFIIQGNFLEAEQESRAGLSQMASDYNFKSLLADALMGQRRYKEAETILQFLAKTQPVQSNFHRLSKVLAEQGRYEDAANSYKTSLGIKIDKGTISAWRGLGAKLRKIDQKQRAYKIWQGILKDYPKDVATLIAIGRASHQDKLLQQSLDYYARVLEKEPNNKVAHFSRSKIFFSQLNFEMAEIEIRSILNHSPSNNKAKLALIDVLIVTNRSKEAEQILRPLVDRESNPEYLTRLAKILAETNKNEESARYFKESLKADPENIKAVQGLARVLWNQHRFEESTKLLQDYLETHPNKDFVRARLAEHATAAAKWVLAEQEFKVLIDKYPMDNRWKVKLAYQLDMAGQHKEASALAKQVVAKEPNVTALKLLANNAIFSGDIVEGIRWLKEIIRIKPSSERLNQLGKLHISRGASHAEENKYEEAMIQYAAASKEFQRAAELDPIKSRAQIGLVESLRLRKKYSEAEQLANELYTMHPNSVDIIQQLVNLYKDKGDFLSAYKWLKVKQPFFPENTKLQQNLAKFTFYSGEQKQGLQMLKELQDKPNHQRVQVLLYHGITVSERQDTVSVKIFRDQMLALKKEGYHSITMDQLLDFLNGEEGLPEKPILITFDDARTDSLRYADPILEEAGFQATMFVPVVDVATHGAYTAVWSTLRDISKTGRWDMQCHGTEAQHYVPVNKIGNMGRFMANKRWIGEDNHLETNKEFSTRIGQDLKTCKEIMGRELPNSDVFAFAFPYSDQGHRSLSNAQDVFSLNHEQVKKQFQLAFHVNNNYSITRNTPRYSLPRFEVIRTFTGDDLVKALKDIDPAISGSYELAGLEMNAGNYAQAIRMYEDLEREGSIDKAELMAKKGKALSWSGDHVGARKQLDKANAMQPNDPAIMKEIAALDRRLKHVVKIEGRYFEDNADRSYYSFGPTIEVPISDSLSLSAYYKYLNFDQTLNSANTGLDIDEQSFRAHGHQFEGRFNYELGANSSLSLSAGMADFSGHSSPASTKSGSTFPLGSIKLKQGMGKRLDLLISADHTYVNTAGAIMNGLAFSRARTGFNLKLLDSLNLKANYAYSYYTDDNQRNRTEIELDSQVWNYPEVTIGAQFIYDDIQKDNDLFWTPNKYVSFNVPFNIKKKWGSDLITELYIAPGMGKEENSEFKFQLNSTGAITWNYKDDINVYLSASRYEASTYSNYSVFAGGFLRF